jgi:hypothetical protein
MIISHDCHIYVLHYSRNYLNQTHAFFEEILLRIIARLTSNALGSLMPHRFLLIAGNSKLRVGAVSESYNP